MAYGKLGRVSDAIAEFKQSIKLNENEIGSYLALSRYYLSIDSLKTAEVTLYRAQAINGQDARSFLGLAELYERQRIPELAIGQYEQAMKIDPNNVTVHAKLAGLYFRTRKYNESAGEWLKITGIDSTYAPAYYQIANLYFLGKQYDVSRRYATRYAELRPADISGQWLLARSLTAIQLMSASPLAVENPLSHQFMTWMVDGLSLVLPALDRFTRSVWLADAAAGWSTVADCAAQALLYSSLLIAASMFDFYRRNL